LEKAGVPDIRFHDLRHSCASLLLQAGIDVKTISERLGHSNVAITLSTYIHTSADAQKKAAAALGNILGSKGDKPEAK
jgi:integrase